MLWDCCSISKYLFSDGVTYMSHVFLCVFFRNVFAFTMVFILSSTPLSPHIHSNGSSEVSGGAIRTEIGSNVCVEDSRFKRNEAGVSGGGIYGKGELQLINSVFEENKAHVVRKLRRGTRISNTSICVRLV